MSKSTTSNNESLHTVGIDTAGSRWITCKLTNEEINLLLGMKISMKEAGLSIPMTQLVRKILDIGIANLDKEALKSNPLSLFQYALEGAAK